MFLFWFIPLLIAVAVAVWLMYRSATRNPGVASQRGFNLARWRTRIAEMWI